MGLKLPKTLREWAIAILVATWGVFGAAIGAPWITALAGQVGFFSNPAGQVTTVLGWVIHLTNHLWFGWAAGALLAGSAGFAAGVWLDAIVRKRSPIEAKAKATPSAQSPTPATAPPSANIRLRNRITDPELTVQLRKTIVKDWGRPGSFELYQVACLWGNQLPPANYLMPISQHAQASLEMLKAAVIDGEIARASGPRSAMEDIGGPGFVDRQTRVARQDLISFAKARGDYPLFLFPDGEATGLV